MKTLLTKSVRLSVMHFAAVSDQRCLKLLVNTRIVLRSKKCIAFDDDMAVDLISWKWITRKPNYYENHRQALLVSGITETDKAILEAYS